MSINPVLQRQMKNQLADFWDKMFEKDMAKVVRQHAGWGAVAMLIPGLDIVIFVLVLWHMYSTLCKKCNQEFGWKSVRTGLVVNIIAAIVIDLLDFIPIAGQLGSSILIYFQFCRVSCL